MFFSLLLYLVCSGALLFFDKRWDAYFQITMLIHMFAGLVFVPLCFVFIFRHIKERVALRFMPMLFILSSFFAFATLAANFPPVTLVFLMILLVASYRIYKASFTEEDILRKKMLVTGPVALFFLGIIIATGLLIFIGSAAYPGGRFLNVVHGYAGVFFTVVLVFHLFLRRRQALLLRVPFILETSGHLRKAFSFTAYLCCATLILTLLYAADVSKTKLEGQDLFSVYGGKFYEITNARTPDNKTVPASVIADSKGCGGFGCHQEIYQQWKSSAHHYGGTSPFFVKTAERMMREKGKDWVTLCAGCHTPAALLTGSGTNEMFEEGVSCPACHFIREASVKGNASYVFALPEKKYLYQGTGIAGWRGSLSCFLVRLKSSLHRAQMGRETGKDVQKEIKIFRPSLTEEEMGKAFYKTPEFCAPCHKVTLPKAFNGVRDIPVWEPGISWEAGPYGRVPENSRVFVTCNDCHMPQLVRNYYGDLIRDHRFPGANTALPFVFQDTDMLSFMQKWLSGKIHIKELEGKTPQNTVLQMDITTEKNKDGAAIITVRTKNTGDGHVFPVGPLDLLRVWLEVEARNEHGKLVYTNVKKQNGKTTDDMEQLNPYLGAKVLNKEGSIIDYHRIWTTVAAKDKHVLMPDEEQTFTFSLPRAVTSKTVRVQARWLYKKVYDDFFRHITGRADSAPVAEICNLKTNVVLK